MTTIEGRDREKDLQLLRDAMKGRAIVEFTYQEAFRVLGYIAGENARGMKDYVFDLFREIQRSALEDAEALRRELVAVRERIGEVIQERDVTRMRHVEAMRERDEARAALAAAEERYTEASTTAETLLLLYAWNAGRIHRMDVERLTGLSEPQLILMDEEFLKAGEHLATLTPPTPDDATT